MNWTYIFLIMMVVCAVFINGCAGQGIELANDISEKRQKIKSKTEVLFGKYRAGREIYVELRQTYRTARQYYQNNREDFPNDLHDNLDSMDEDLNRLDEKLVLIDKKIGEIREQLRTYDRDVQRLETKLKEADRAWSDVLAIMKNVSELGVAVAS